MDKIISEVTKDCDSMYLPQNGGLSSQGPPITLPASWFPGAPGGLRGWLFPLPLLDPQALPRSADALSTASICQTSDPLVGRGTYLAFQPASSFTPAIPCSGHSRLRGLGWSRATGLAIVPPTPMEGQPGTAAVSPHPVCVCVHTF